MNEIIFQIKKSCIEISNLLREYIPGNSKTNIINNSNDNVNKVDLLSNEIIKTNLKNCKSIHLIGSEEEDKLLIINKEGKYLVAFDPLDGSKNIDLNLPTGSIFGIYDLPEDKNYNNIDGNSLKYACYCLYSSATIFVESSNITKSYILVNNEYKLINDNMYMPEEGNIYSINEGNKNLWNSDIKRVINNISYKGKSLRYDGCMVADVHRILINGGIFLYPEDNKNKYGKLRLIYEAWPISFIARNIGGRCIGGLHIKNIFEIKFPKNIHQKIPLIICGKEEFKLLF